MAAARILWRGTRPVGTHASFYGIVSVKPPQGVISSDTTDRAATEWSLDWGYVAVRAKYYGKAHREGTWSMEGTRAVLELTNIILAIVQ
jgi:hypothetical protein